MTSPEHTLVGIHLAFACGLHRRFGWKAVAMAAVASNVPDWDGLPMLFDMQRFEAGHRAWGHSLVSIALTSLILGVTQAVFDWLGAIGKWLSKRFPNLIPEPADAARMSAAAATLTFMGIALISQLLHLPCDMVVSGGSGLTDWPIQVGWPFSKQGYVFPLIPWGDVGPTLILMSGVLVIAKRRSQVPATSALTLIALVVYLIVRGWSRGEI